MWCVPAGTCQLSFSEELFFGKRGVKQDPGVPNVYMTNVVRIVTGEVMNVWALILSEVSE